MSQNVTVCGRNINAIVIETDPISAKEYRRSLINILKCALLWDGDLEKEDVWNVLNVIQETEPKEEGGEA